MSSGTNVSADEPGPDTAVAVPVTALAFSASGGLGGIAVSAPDASLWVVQSVPDWIHVGPVVASTGSRTVTLEVDPNSTGVDRAASIHVAGTSFVVNQSATSGRLVNISTRGRAGTGDDVLIAGMVTVGPRPLPFLMRGVGPGLARFELSSLLPNPSLDVKEGAVTRFANDDWDAGTESLTLESEADRVGAFPLVRGAGDAALLATIPAGTYTAKLWDPSGAQGIALAEFYDRTAAEDAEPLSRAINISTRGHVGQGDDVLIAGFVITGTAPKQVLIRGVGPSLAPLGIAGCLADPVIRLMKDGVPIDGNDDWGYSAQADVLAAAYALTGAFALDPQSRDAALITTLPPGAYSVIVSGAGGGAGIALAEVYDLEVPSSHAETAAGAMIDLDGDGLDDLWELYYGVDQLEAAADADGDGLSNREESRRWSDPLRADAGAPGFTGLAASADYATADSDNDGLADIAEALLGTDPLRAASGGAWAGGDMSRAVALVGSEQTFSLGGKTVHGRPPSARQAARFLMQASLGGTSEDIAAVSDQGFEGWLEAQFSKPPSYTYLEVLPQIAAGVPYQIHHAWWRQVLTGDDLLRQRMAVAMTEIFVVSEAVIDVQWELAKYYDTLGELSFANWRDLLDMVTFHPLMGHYLNHLRNRKADPALGRYPDENYAREVMQLFSIGLWELNPDGTHRLDAQGREIPTYDNTTITNFARVFTGMSFSGNGADTTKLADFLGAPMNYEARMAMWDGEHDQEAKELLRGVRLPAFSDAPGRTGLDDVRDAIDNVFDHPNVGPFFGRLLIQRLVTSNPSPGYIRRVAQVFADNGHGIRGDMRAFIRAILLDPEARNAPSGGVRTGRLREPYLRYVRLARTFKARSADGTIYNNDHATLESINQILLNSPSVFNFFLPDYLPPGDMAAAGVYGPEFQIMTSTTAITTLNLFMRVVDSGFGDDPNGPGTLRLDFSEELARADDPAALLDLLDLKMACGALSPRTREILLQAWTEMPTDFTPAQRVHALVQLITLSPDFAVIE